MQRRRINLEEFQTELKAQNPGFGHMDAAFVCPMCKTVQSSRDLIRAGAGKDFDEVEKYLGFSCVGRFTGAGEYSKKKPSGQGCNWSLGGLLQIHELEVLTEDGQVHPRFKLATTDEAKLLAKRNGVCDVMDAMEGKNGA